MAYSQHASHGANSGRHCAAGPLGARAPRPDGAARSFRSGRLPALGTAGRASRESDDHGTVDVDVDVDSDDSLENEDSAAAAPKRFKLIGIGVLGGFFMWMVVFPPNPYSPEAQRDLSRGVVLLGVLHALWAWTSDETIPMHTYRLFALSMMVNVGFLAVSRVMFSDINIDISSLGSTRSLMMLVIVLGAVFLHYVISTAAKGIEDPAAATATQ